MLSDTLCKSVHHIFSDHASKRREDTRLALFHILGRTLTPFIHQAVSHMGTWAGHEIKGEWLVLVTLYVVVLCM